MKIFMVTPEAVPYAKTGGLADVTGALIKEFRKSGQETFLILPFYTQVERKGNFIDTGIRLYIEILSQKIEASILQSADRDAPAYFIRADRFFMRDGLYGDSGGDYPDNCLRFSFFSRAVLELFKALKIKPDVIQVHDWQTALIPFYLRNFYKNDPFFKNTVTVLTIHNLGYQGLFSPTELPYTGIGFEYFNPDGIEFYGKINLLKAGILSADAITTVSESYAREILTEEYGYGLEGVLRKRAGRLYGILNGIDYSLWNPEHDPSIPCNYSLKSFNGKKICRDRLIRELGFALGKNQPLIGFVGRFVSQKGVDLIEKTIPDILKAGFGIVMIGHGDRNLEELFKKRQKEFKKNLYIKTDYDEDFARKIYAGSDIFLMPSRYEPCGLGQMIAMRYGSVPVARSTGGLRDTIEDYDHVTGRGNGFLFNEYNASAMLESLKRAMCVYQSRRTWSGLIKDGMRRDFSWRASALKYIKLFNILVSDKSP